MNDLWKSIKILCYIMDAHSDVNFVMKLDELKELRVEEVVVDD